MKARLQVENCKLQVARQKLAAGKSFNLQPSTFNPPFAFTLIELLVVISILGILAALSVPALKSLGKSNVATSATQQLLDDVGHARQLAISQRTTVYMVFLPTNFWSVINTSSPAYVSQYAQFLNLSENQLSGYAFISQGKLGDQPGQRQNDWQYLSPWQSLPDNNFIAAWKFYLPHGTLTAVNGGKFTVGSFPRGAVPFPTATNPLVALPFIAFNYLGQLTTNGVDASFADEYIPLAQGSVGYGYNGKTKSPTLTTVAAKDIVETPAGSSTGSTFNLVHVDALTGRARLEFQKVQ